MNILFLILAVFILVFLLVIGSLIRMRQQEQDIYENELIMKKYKDELKRINENNKH